MSQTNINNFHNKIEEIKKNLKENSGAKIKAVSEKLNEQLNGLEKFVEDIVLSYENELSKLPNLQKMNEEFKNKVIDIENSASKKVMDKIEEIDKKKKEEVENAKKYAIEKSISSAINVIDQLEIAINFATNDPAVKNYVSGFKMVLDMFLKWLSELGIKQINVKPNDPFNEQIMSAIEKVSSNLMKNHVVKVMKSGYMLYDKIIRHAAVTVSDGSQATQSLNQNQVQTVAINQTIPTTHIPATQQVQTQQFNNTQNIQKQNLETRQINQNINQQQNTNFIRQPAAGPTNPNAQQQQTNNIINNPTKKV